MHQPSVIRVFHIATLSLFEEAGKAGSHGQCFPVRGLTAHPAEQGCVCSPCQPERPGSWRESAGVPNVHRVRLTRINLITCDCDLAPQKSPRTGKRCPWLPVLRQQGSASLKVAQTLALQRVCGSSVRDAHYRGIMRGHVTAARASFVGLVLCSCAQPTPDYEHPEANRAIKICGWRRKSRRLSVMRESALPCFALREDSRVGNTEENRRILRATGCQGGRTGGQADSPPDLGGAGAFAPGGGCKAPIPSP